MKFHIFRDVSMADSQHTWVCSVCGHTQEKRTELCNGCGEYKKFKKATVKAAEVISSKKSKVTFTTLKTSKRPPPKFLTGMDQFDRVFGGGLTEGSVILLSGDPGIGKSTLLLQILAKIASSGKSCVFISGEEASSNLQQNAKRLGIQKAPVDIAEATSVEHILSSLLEREATDVLVIDSIQTMSVRRFRSAPGTVTQVRACTQALTRFARRNKIVLFLVCHVTKDGKAAGPNLIAHIVDVKVHLGKSEDGKLRVLCCEGKNRFGPSDRIGLFTMTEDGLAEAIEEERSMYNNKEFFEEDGH